MMKKPVLLFGVGEMGGVFARAILKIGYPVYPITRQMDLSKIHESVPDPEAVVIAVGEKDLNNCLKAIPQSWRDRLVLLQNELLPKDWQAHSIKNPTVISVWFEKKWPQDYKVIIPSPVFGLKASLIEEAFQSMKIPVTVLNNEDELLVELVVKNLYILTINIAGLKIGGTVEELWKQHESLARDVANDILDIQFFLIGKKFDREKLIQKMLKAFAGDWQHKCMGRTAQDRLARAIAQADEAKLKVPMIRRI